MDLWTRHYALLADLFIVAGLHPMTVAAVIVGYDVTQEVFDITLNSLNMLARTYYTLDDLSGVNIVAPYIPRTSQVDEEKLCEELSLQHRIQCHCLRYISICPRCDNSANSTR